MVDLDAQVVAVQGRIAVLDADLADFESSGLDNRMRLALATGLNRSADAVFVKDVASGATGGDGGGVVVELLIVFHDFEEEAARDLKAKLGSSPEKLLASDPVFARRGVADEQVRLRRTLLSHRG